jgi:hypothetical protein
LISNGSLYSFRSKPSRFCDGGRHNDPSAARSHRKLLSDLERAETDLEQSLDVAMAVEGLDL